MFLLTGCYKDVIVIEDLRNTIGDTTQTSSSSKTNIVNIAPVVGGYTSSGASSVTEFQAGGIVQAFVFISGLQFLESPCFKSLKAGTLTPVSNPLELVSGEYYFYMTSTNSANYPPVFTSSSATAIPNVHDI